MYVALILAKSGWWGGDPGKVLNAPADEVMLALQFGSFRSDYERTYVDLNKEKDS